MGVSKNNGTPKSSILIDLIGFSTINHPFRGTPIFGNTHISTGEFAGFLDRTINRHHVPPGDGWKLEVGRLFLLFF